MTKSKKTVGKSPIEKSMGEKSRTRKKDKDTQSFIDRRGTEMERSADQTDFDDATEIIGSDNTERPPDDWQEARKPSYPSDVDLSKAHETIGPSNRNQLDDDDGFLESSCD